MTPQEKPISPSCERNRDVILAVLQKYFAVSKTVIEIGSGTGQHAVHFAQALPHLTWQCSDLPEALAGITMWIDEARLANLSAPIALDADGIWPNQPYDAVFSANTLHIMSWPCVEQLFAKLPAILADNATLVIYGPFNYEGKFTSESNAKFNDWLQAKGAHMAIRDFEAVNALAEAAGLELLEDREMPANNRCLIWRRRAAPGARLHVAP